MPPAPRVRRRIDPAAGATALSVCRAAGLLAGATPAPALDATTPGADAHSTVVPRETVATAVRWTLEELALAAPGRAVEVRVPPYAAVQCLPGPTHRRGTPPTVIETDPVTWLRLAVGELSWAEALSGSAVLASGARADLSAWLPVPAAIAPAPAEQADQGR